MREALPATGVSGEMGWDEVLQKFEAEYGEGDPAVASQRRDANAAVSDADTRVAEASKLVDSLEPTLKAAVAASQAATQAAKVDVVDKACERLDVNAAGLSLVAKTRCACEALGLRVRGLKLVNPAHDTAENRAQLVKLTRAPCAALLERVQALLDLGVDPDETKDYPHLRCALWRAADCDQAGTINALLRAGAAPNLACTVRCVRARHRLKLESWRGFFCAHRNMKRRCCAQLYVEVPTASAHSWLAVPTRPSRRL